MEAGASESETVMTKQTGLSVIETAQRMFEEYGMEEALAIANSLASSNGKQGMFYRMVFKALREVAEDID